MQNKSKVYLAIQNKTKGTILTFKTGQSMRGSQTSRRPMSESCHATSRSTDHNYNFHREMTNCIGPSNNSLDGVSYEATLLTADRFLHRAYDRSAKHPQVVHCVQQVDICVIDDNNHNRTSTGFSKLHSQTFVIPLEMQYTVIGMWQTHK